MKEFRMVRKHWKEIVESLKKNGIKSVGIGEVNGIKYDASGCEFCKRWSKRCEECPFVVVYGKGCVELFWRDFSCAVKMRDVKSAIREGKKCLRLIDRECERKFIEMTRGLE
jgi:hypothetical protein